MKTFEQNGCCLGEVLILVHAGQELFSKKFGGKHVQVYFNLYLLLQRCLLVFHDGL